MATRFKRLTSNNRYVSGAVLSEEPSSADQCDVIPETPKVSKIAPSLPLESTNSYGKRHTSWERTEAPLPQLRTRPKCDFIQSATTQSFPERLELPYSSLQKRLSIFIWNSGPRRGKEDDFEKQIAVKWHIVTLQEASDYVEHDILHERFHVTHYAGCAILFNKDTFHPDISVKSIYLNDTRHGVQDHVVEGEQGWVLQGVLSRASFRQAAASGQKFFSVLSLRVSNIYAKKKGIAKNLILTLRAIMISQEVDLVAGDFNGTAWRCRSGDNISTIDEAFADCAFPTPPGPTPLWGPRIHPE